MRPTTIGLINQKGGCGKSSICFHLAGAFAQAGERVLLVDADPQGSLSQGFFGSNLVECLEPQETYEQKLRRLYGSTVFRTILSEASAFKVSLACRQPVSQYAPRSQAARLMSQLADEITERIRLSQCQERIA